jgi:hypothetical protein
VILIVIGELKLREQLIDRIDPIRPLTRSIFCGVAAAIRPSFGL